VLELTLVQTGDLLGLFYGFVRWFDLDFLAFGAAEHFGKKRSRTRRY
jgi:hypothetical protein